MSPAAADMRPGRDGFSLRTRPARWFELLVARDDLTAAVETLARTGRVELETHSEPTSRMRLPDLHDRLEEYHRLAQQYQAYWPAGPFSPSTTPGHPTDTLDRALSRLHGWREAADPLVREMEHLASERDTLNLLDEMLLNLGDSPLRLDQLARAGPAMASRLFVLPPRSRVREVPTGVISTGVRGQRHDFLLALGPQEEVAALEQEVVLQKGRRLAFHGCLQDGVGASRRVLRERLATIAEEEERLGGQLEALQARHELEQALGDIARLEWFLSHVASLPVTENFAWVTGWTSDLQDQELRQALEAAGVRGLLRYPEPPRDKRPPMVMHNPWWARPFELFARLLGTPDQNEADPSRLLALFVPLMFGYMFGDVGQGAVLLAAGLALQRRWPASQLLIPAGASSILFGLLFGSVFSREDLLPALWLHPFAEPVIVLVAPLVGGVLILVLGLVLNGIEARWRGEARRWWQQEAATVLLYLGLVAAFFHSAGLWLALAGLVWYFTGSLPHAEGAYGRVLAQDAGLLLEHALQLAVNTLSFARVGAFALAHSGLSTAVATLADTADAPVVSGLIMVLGNALIIALEGLVVSIQTTRLVLFEFFIRFLRGEGRGFRPLAAPPVPEQAQRSQE